MSTLLSPAASIYPDAFAGFDPDDSPTHPYRSIGLPADLDLTPDDDAAAYAAATDDVLAYLEWLPENPVASIERAARINAEIVAFQAADAAHCRACGCPTAGVDLYADHVQLCPACAIDGLLRAVAPADAALIRRRVTSPLAA